MIAYYEILFVCAVILSVVFFTRLKNYHDISYIFIFLLVLISEFGALVRSLATNLEASIIGNDLSYIGGCFLQITVTFLIFALCRMKVPQIIKTLMIVIGFIMYGLIITNPYTHIFYKSTELGYWKGITLIHKEYGWGHTLFYVMVIAFFIVNIIILVYGAIKKKEASVNNILIMAILEFINLAVYFIQKLFPDGIQLTAATYVISLVVFLIIMERVTLYDIDNTVMDALLKHGDIGCISFSLKKKYLGCNSVAQEWFPELSTLRVDTVISKYNIDLLNKINEWIKDIDQDNSKHNYNHTVEGRSFKIEGGYLYNGRKIVGYQFTIRDNTQERKYIDLINRYNTELEKDVEKKTEHVREMQERLVLGMADMVESRDNSTGGHIKRTSQVIRILVESMENDHDYVIKPEFAKAVIKAAPMHDLGKIAVDDVILRKPGKFTPEEFEKMKIHASEGAIIVKRLLGNLDDDYFAKIAENVAHYHHEKYNGTGYPYGLKGEDIPLEARIMAIADVYDALVSKRFYKERMDFEEAYNIIEDSMGTHFDPSLNKFFVDSRSKLEEFYKAEFKKEE